MNITVVGAGYVGTSVAMLLDMEHNVTIVDVDAEKVAKINSKMSPISDDEIEKTISSSSVVATTDAESAYKSADYVIIAVPTNYDKFQNSFDVSTLKSVVKKVCEVNNSAKIVIKSTVPIGSTDELNNMYNNVILFSPEFLREGKALFDNLYPSRIIVGCNDVHRLYALEFAEMMRGASKNDAPVFIMGTKEAESVKLFANTYLAMRVSFFNELDTFAELKCLNSKSIIQGVSADPRVGDFYNNPSFGYGGYCLPKDTKQLLSNYGKMPQNLITAIVDSNKTRKLYLASKIRQFINDKGVIGAYKLAMKSGSDNFRESAILDVIEYAYDSNVEVVLYEPALTQDYFNLFRVIHDFDEFVNKCDVIVANRVDEELREADVMDKIYTRDVYNRD